MIDTQSAPTTAIKMSCHQSVRRVDHYNCKKVHILHDIGSFLPIFREKTQTKRIQLAGRGQRFELKNASKWPLANALNIFQLFPSSSFATHPLNNYLLAVGHICALALPLSLPTLLKKENSMDVSRKFFAELIGTFWLVFAGCGSALLAAGFTSPAPDSLHLGIGFVGVSLAFGLTVVSMAYGIGHISGAHLNPAVTLGAFMGGRMHVKDVVPYFVAQFAGGVIAAFLLFFICSGADGYDPATYAGVCNGFGEHSPGKYSMVAAFVTEAVLTFIFLMVILGSTDWRSPAGFAGLAIGLCLTLIHLFAIPVTNCSVNPARSLGPAIVAMTNGQSWPMAQIWLFFAAPAAGAALAGVVYRAVFHQANPDA